MRLNFTAADGTRLATVPDATAAPNRGDLVQLDGAGSTWWVQRVRWVLAGPPADGSDWSVRHVDVDLTETGDRPER